MKLQVRKNIRSGLLNYHAESYAQELLKNIHGDFGTASASAAELPGILEHFAHMYEFTGDEEFYDYMIRTANVMLSDSDHRTPGKRTWYDSWWRTIPTRIVSYVGLYVGAAGCGSWHVCFAPYAAMKGKKLTNLYEYRFFED